jgi:putative ABC transport system ATP-binding protein
MDSRPTDAFNIDSPTRVVGPSRLVTMVEFRDVTKVYGRGETAVTAVRSLSFTCPSGAFWAIMGPSGSGKSTLLHLIAGLTAPTAGSVLVEGRDVAKMTEREAATLRRRRVGYVLQTFNLMPVLTAAENVGMPLVLDGVPQRSVTDRVGEALEMVGMSHRAAHRPAHLSGGEQQRVAIARALVIRPAIMLADEPTGSLDRANGQRIMALIRDLNERTDVTVLLVTHDPACADHADRTVRMMDGVLQDDASQAEASVVA